MLALFDRMPSDWRERDRRSLRGYFGASYERVLELQ
jgi:hypothetical protein